MLRLMTSWVGVVLLISAFAGSTAAQQRRSDPCRDATGEESIAACTRDIASGKFKGDALAVRFHNRGIEYSGKGEYDRAIADYNEAIRLNPKNATFFRDRGVAYGLKNEYDRAIADYTEALRLNPKDPATFDERGYAYKHKGQYDRAIADYNEAIRLDPKNATFFRDRGVAYGLKDEYDRAIPDLNEAIRLDPKSSEAFRNRGYAYNGKGEYDRAIPDLNEAIRLNPKDTRAFSERGFAYSRKSQYDRAIADYTEAIRLDPKDAVKFNERGLAYNNKGEYDRAIADLNEAIRLDPKNADAFNNRGFAYHGKGDYNRAIADYDAALKLDAGLDATIAAIEGSVKAKAALADQQRPVGSSLAAVAPSKPASIASVPASPGRRVALVIGNANYTSLHALRNPVNDATDMAAALKELGFEVSLGLDLNRNDMEEKMIRFAREARQAATALVYYSGHGLQHQGVNYLAPVDTQFKDESDLRRLVRLQDVIGDLQNASRVRIMIVDACRDNEALQQVASTYSATKAMGFDRGLAPAPAAKGTLLAFATQANRVAADGSGRNSPFTKALLKHLPEAGVELRTFLTRVRTDVDRETDGEQLPEVSDSLVGEFILKAGP